MISPHSMHNGVFEIDGVKSVSCGFGVRIGGSFVSKKYTTKGLEGGSFAPGCVVKNVDATFGMNAQLKPKHYQYMPAELVKAIHAEPITPGGPSFTGPSIAAVLNDPKHAYTRQLIAAVPPLKAPPPRLLSSENILTISGVSKTYRTGGFLGRGARVTPAVKNVSLSLPRGATLGIVGESGSGKSTLARCIVRLIDPDQGSILLEGNDWAKMSRENVRRETRHIQMVFQDPFASLNPRRKAAELVAQGPIVHGTPRAKAIADARELFALVGLDPSAGDRFPHEFSGGQRQRIGLARALALKPAVLVADEPVSALDVSVQAQVLKLLAELRQRLGLSIVFITHDLRVAAQICDLVAVMKDGAVVEHGLAGDVFGNPQHPYTQALLASIPGGDFTRKRDTALI